MPPFARAHSYSTLIETIILLIIGTTRAVFYAHILVVPALIIVYCYASVVRVVWRHGRGEVQTSAKDGGSALRRTVPSPMQPHATITVTVCSSLTTSCLLFWFIISFFVSIVNDYRRCCDERCVTPWFRSSYGKGQLTLTRE